MLFNLDTHLTAGKLRDKTMDDKFTFPMIIKKIIAFYCKIVGEKVRNHPIKILKNKPTSERTYL